LSVAPPGVKAIPGAPRQRAGFTFSQLPRRDRDESGPCSQPRVLIILTSHVQLGTTGKPTGFWFEELAAPYYELTDAGATVDLASPAGGQPPIDPKSLTDEGPVARFRNDAVAMAKLEATHKLADVKTAYDGYFVVGGHGVMWDLANHPEVQRILGGAADAGRRRAQHRALDRHRAQ
jgi:hypothetical protein